MEAAPSKLAAHREGEPVQSRVRRRWWIAPVLLVVALAGAAVLAVAGGRDSGTWPTGQEVERQIEARYREIAETSDAKIQLLGAKCLVRLPNGEYAEQGSPEDDGSTNEYGCLVLSRRPYFEVDGFPVPREDHCRFLIFKLGPSKTYNAWGRLTGEDGEEISNSKESVDRCYRLFGPGADGQTSTPQDNSEYGYSRLKEDLLDNADRRIGLCVKEWNDWIDAHGAEALGDPHRLVKSGKIGVATIVGGGSTYEEQDGNEEFNGDATCTFVLWVGDPDGGYGYVYGHGPEFEWLAGVAQGPYAPDIAPGEGIVNTTIDQWGRVQYAGRAAMFSPEPYE